MTPKTILLPALAALCIASCVHAGKPGTAAKTVVKEKCNDPKSKFRFHCKSDTLRIEELLKQGKQSGLSDAGELMIFYAQKLLGVPYVAHTLEGSSEMLTINIHQLDCTTLIETIYSLTRATQDGSTRWRQFAKTLENLRYRNGKMAGYESRLHYFSDWFNDNEAMDNVVDITPQLPGVMQEVKTLNYMSTHPEKYLSLKNDKAMVQKIKQMESQYVKHRFPYIPKAATASQDFKDNVRNGDIIAMVTSNPGIDASHLGVVYKNEAGEVYMLDASSLGMKVQLEKLPLDKMLAKRKTNKGVRILRLTDK